MKKYIKLLTLLLIASLNFNIILKPLKIVTGGTQGLALIINDITKIDTSLIILIINVLMLITSYIFLPKKTTYGTIISTFIYPLFVKLTSNINIPNENIIYVIITGIICGITGGYIFKLGFSSGGINVIPILLKKYMNIKIPISNIIINGIIILLSYKEFGLIKTIYSIIVIIINTIVINKILKNN